MITESRMWDRMRFTGRCIAMTMGRGDDGVQSTRTPWGQPAFLGIWPLVQGRQKICSI